MKSEIFVACKGMSIGYHERSLVAAIVKSDLNLRAFGGEMVALIGGNGIGKSTLLKTIAGFQSPLAGELVVHHRAVQDYRKEDLAREMSFVSTEIVKVANLTVREMVGLGRFPYTNWFGQLDEKDHQQVEEAIRQVGLSGYEDRLINRISDGERQRAMIARALAQDTKIMVLDEPTAFLDISNKYEIVRILHQLAYEKGKCIIFSTHELNTAISMADRIWLMLNDQVLEGVPEEMAMKGYFESLFANNPHLFFDAEKGDFRVRKKSEGTIYLAANGAELDCTKKALERLGFEIVVTSSIPESPSLRVPQPNAFHVNKIENGWLITTSGYCMEVESLEELCRTVKRIRIQQEF